MSYDHHRLLRVLGAELLGALTTSQRAETGRAADEDEAGVERLAKNVLALPDVASPAALFLSKLRRGEHHQRRRLEAARADRTETAEIDFALRRYRARLDRYGDPADALDYAVEWSVQDHGGPLDATSLEAALRDTLGGAAPEPRETASDADVRRWERVGKVLTQTGPRAALAVLLARSAVADPAEARALLLVLEATARRDHADLWAATEPLALRAG